MPYKTQHGIFNREYHRRAAKQALKRVGAGLRPDTSGFYRPERRPNPVSARLDPRLLGGHGIRRADPRQLSLDFTDPARPLADLFPEAYETEPK